MNFGLHKFCTLITEQTCYLQLLFVLFTFKLWVVNGYFSVFFSKFDAANMLYK